MLQTYSGFSKGEKKLTKDLDFFFASSCTRGLKSGLRGSSSVSRSSNLAWGCECVVQVKEAAIGITVCEQPEDAMVMRLIYCVMGPRHPAS